MPCRATGAARQDSRSRQSAWRSSHAASTSWRRCGRVAVVEHPRCSARLHSVRMPSHIALCPKTTSKQACTQRSPGSADARRRKGAAARPMLPLAASATAGHQPVGGQDQNAAVCADSVPAPRDQPNVSAAGAAPAGAAVRRCGVARLRRHLSVPHVSRRRSRGCRYCQQAAARL
eukprot:237396-Chlamydomonas_euryale.AAC.4